MVLPPVLRLTDEEVDYLKKQVYYQVYHDRHLHSALADNKPVFDWVLSKVLMTADHFKIRYSKDD